MTIFFLSYFTSLSPLFPQLLTPFAPPSAESIERLFDTSHVVIHSGEMVVGAIVAFLLHLMVTHFHCANYALFNHVIEAASSSWLQEQVADISHSLSHFMPGVFSSVCACKCVCVCVCKCVCLLVRLLVCVGCVCVGCVCVGCVCVGCVCLMCVCWGCVCVCWM